MIIGDFVLDGNIKKTIGQRFKEMRLSKGYTQEEFGKLLGYSQSFIAEIERGNLKPSRNILIALKSNLDININWLLANDGPMHYPPSHIKTTAAKLSHYQTKEGISNEKFAEMLNITAEELVEITNGNCEPSPEIIARFLDATNVNPFWVISDEGGMYDRKRHEPKEIEEFFFTDANKKGASKVSERVKSFFKVEDVPLEKKAKNPYLFSMPFEVALEEISGKGIAGLNELEFVAINMEKAYREARHDFQGSSLSAEVNARWVENILKAFDVILKKGKIVKLKEVGSNLVDELYGKGSSLEEKISAALKFFSSRKTVDSKEAQNIAGCFCYLVRRGVGELSEEIFKELRELLEPWCFWVARKAMAPNPPPDLEIQDLSLLVEDIRKEGATPFSIRRETLDLHVYLMISGGRKTFCYGPPYFPFEIEFKGKGVCVPFKAGSIFNLMQCINQNRSGRKVGTFWNMRLYSYEGQPASLHAFGVTIDLSKEEYEDLVSAIEEAVDREDVKQKILKEYVERYGML